MRKAWLLIALAVGAFAGCDGSAENDSGATGRLDAAKTTSTTTAPAGSSASVPGDTSTTEVGSITDGDTFRTIDGTRVRLIGVDTPEVDENACFASEATGALTEMIPPGTAVRLVLDVEPLDRFGRTLAYVHRAADDLFVNRELALQGYAVQLTVPPNVARADELGAAVAEARAEGRGLWSACGDVG